MIARSEPSEQPEFKDREKEAVSAPKWPRRVFPGEEGRERNWQEQGQSGSFRVYPHTTFVLAFKGAL